MKDPYLVCEGSVASDCSALRRSVRRDECLDAELFGRPCSEACCCFATTSTALLNSDDKQT